MTGISNLFKRELGIDRVKGATKEGKEAEEEESDTEEEEEEEEGNSAEEGKEAEFHTQRSGKKRKRSRSPSRCGGAARSSRMALNGQRDLSRKLDELSNHLTAFGEEVRNISRLGAQVQAEAALMQAQMTEERAQMQTQMQAEMTEERAQISAEIETRLRAQISAELLAEMQTIFA